MEAKVHQRLGFGGVHFKVLQHGQHRGPGPYPNQGVGLLAQQQRQRHRHEHGSGPGPEHGGVAVFQGVAEVFGEQVGPGDGDALPK